jgi:hypothetical protein
VDYDPFDKSVPVPLDCRPTDFNNLYEAWPDRETARIYWEFVHAADVWRAANPPEINVTLPGLPGPLTTVPGTGVVAWTVPIPVPAALCTSPCTWSRSGARR